MGHAVVLDRARLLQGRPDRNLGAARKAQATAVALLWITCLLAASPAVAQPPSQPDEPWRFSGELSFVQTGGNAESSTLGLAATLIRSWDSAELEIEAGGIRTRTTRTERTGRGTADAFRIEERSESSVSAENYYGRLRLDLALSRRSAVFGKSDWTRNTFAGVAARYLTAAGVSTRWLQRDGWRLRTSYAATYTFQRDVVADPGTEDNFVGMQLSADHWQRLGDDTEWTSTLVIDGNALNLPDLRCDWTNALSVAVSDSFGLKATYRLLFDNRPALASVPLVSPTGDSSDTVSVARSKLDRVLTLAVVVTL